MHREAMVLFLAGFLVRCRHLLVPYCNALVPTSNQLYPLRLQTWPNCSRQPISPLAHKLGEQTTVCGHDPVLAGHEPSDPDFRPSGPLDGTPHARPGLQTPGL